MKNNKNKLIDDIEETADDQNESNLDKENEEKESRNVSLLESKQNELVTSSIDYNLDSLASLINSRKINLEPKYQRRFRWKADRQSKLIESFLMNVPIPPVYLNEDDFGKYSVIDGKQRLNAITEFLNGKLQLVGLDFFDNLNGLNFNDLSPEFQNTLKTRSNIRAIIILRQSSRDIKYEVFTRLNTGGIRLNAQEIRNSAFPSKFSEGALDLSENDVFRGMLGIKSKTKSRIYQEMYDVELIIRFLSLKDDWSNYRGKLKNRLDEFMEDGKNFDDEKVEELKETFLDSLNKVKIVFGEDGAFRRWIPSSEKWKQQVSIPIFDAQMLTFYGAENDILTANKDEILNDFKTLFTDQEFTKSIESSTATPSRFLYRVNKMKEILDKYVETRN